MNLDGKCEFKEAVFLVEAGKPSPECVKFLEEETERVRALKNRKKYRKPRIKSHKPGSDETYITDVGDSIVVNKTIRY